MVPTTPSAWAMGPITTTPDRAGTIYCPYLSQTGPDARAMRASGPNDRHRSRVGYALLFDPRQELAPMLLFVTTMTLLKDSETVDSIT
jgi:hypothetical protein